MYQPPSLDADYDPNFPPNLDIKPSTYPPSSAVSNDRSRFGDGRNGTYEAQSPVNFGENDDHQDKDAFEQLEGIKQYGIAGKVWDASYPILPYLSHPSPFPSSSSSSHPSPPLFEFDPPCSIFPSASSSPYVAGPTSSSSISSGGTGDLSTANEVHSKKRLEGIRELTILELGSGQSLATLHLLDQLLLLGGSLSSPPADTHNNDQPSATSSSSTSSSSSPTLPPSPPSASRHRERGQSHRPRVYLTDLPNVIPLCEKNISRWRGQGRGGGRGRGEVDKLQVQSESGPSTSSPSSSSPSTHGAHDGEAGNGNSSTSADASREREAEAGEAEMGGGVQVEVKIMPLAWGDLGMGEKILEDMRGGGVGGRKLTHVLLIDLIYFPHLYPPLMRTLLQVTGPPFCDVLDEGDSGEGEVGGPEVVLTYKTRSLEFEEPFFNTLGFYFQLTPLLSRKRLSGPGMEDTSRTTSPDDSGSEDHSGTKSSGYEHGPWRVHGVEDETYTYICRRWKRTLLDGWAEPKSDEALMNGGGMEKVGADRGFGWVEGQLGAIEWD